MTRGMRRNTDNVGKQALPERTQMDTITQKLDELAGLVGETRRAAPAEPAPAELRRLRWWIAAMAAVTFSALAVAAVAVVVLLTS